MGELDLGAQVSQWECLSGLEARQSPPVAMPVKVLLPPVDPASPTHGDTILEEAGGAGD